MDNITFEKVWEDDCIIEIKVTAIPKKVTACQTFYTDKEKLHSISQQIINYTKVFTKTIYIETGKKTGRYTPVFSMKMMNSDMLGNVKIEVDVEIDDTSDRTHRCIFYIHTNIGALETFGERLNSLYYSEIGCKFSLHNVW